MCFCWSSSHICQNILLSEKGWEIFGIYDNYISKNTKNKEIKLQICKFTESVICRWLGHTTKKNYHFHKDYKPFRMNINNKLPSFDKIMKISKTYLVNHHQQRKKILPHVLQMLSIMQIIMMGQVVLAQVKNLMNLILFLMQKRNSWTKVILSRMSLKISKSMTGLEKTLLLEI